MHRTIAVCRAVGDGWLADRLPVWMGHKGCGSGAASLARPGCGFGKADAFPKRGREVQWPPMAADPPTAPGAKRPQPGERA